MTQPLGQAGGGNWSAGGPVQVALWLIVILLAVNATILLLAPGSQAAWAQTAPPGVTRNDMTGVFLVPGQIDKELWGAYLVDSRAGTIVLYGYNPNTRRLKLMAARSFIHDRYLESYSTEPPPAEIAELLKPPKPGVPKAPATLTPDKEAPPPGKTD